jgi:starch synthase
VVDAGATPSERTRSKISGRPPHLNLLMVSSEMAPWAKVGGLGDVAAGLPEALDHLGHSVTSVVPLYRGITPPPASATTSKRMRFGQVDHEVTFHVAEISSRRRVVFVACPPLFDRAGMYGEHGRDYADNDRRYGLLSRAALEFIEDDPDSAPFDVLHAHDWQAGLAPAFFRTDLSRWTRLAKAGVVVTIHNLAYQGLFPPESVPVLGLPWEVFRVETGEFWGRFGFLKTGIGYANYVTTVSPKYARETLRTEFAYGMEGVLQALGERYIGILNGIDTNVWDPETDPRLPARYDVNDLTGKTACKRALLETFRFQVGDDILRRPIIGMVSRLVDQKGLDLVSAAIEPLLAFDATWIFVGAGEPRYEQALRTLAEHHPARVSVFIGFDEDLAHLVEAGADMFLMPSTFEPCGLNQMYSLRYGTVPIVHAVGGLDDTIQPYTGRARHANGFKFHDASPEALVRTVRQAIRLYHDRDAWRQLIRQGMTEDHSWRNSAREYVKVYRRARLEGAARVVADAGRPA